MSQDDIRTAIFRILGGIAPEADLRHLNPTANLREELDLDSVDALNFIIGLSKELGVSIPERDYGKTATLNDCIAYVQAALHDRKMA